MKEYKVRKSPKTQKEYTVVDTEKLRTAKNVRTADRNRAEAYEVRTRRREGDKNLFGLPFIPRPVYTVLLILVLCFVSVLVFMNAQGMSPENFVEWAEGKILGISPGGGFPVTIDGSRSGLGNFQLMDGEPVLLSDSSLTMFSRTGAIISNRQHGFATPALKTNGSRALLYDIGGTGFRVENRAALDRESNTTQPIFTGALAQNGVYAIATGGEGFASVISVYSRTHKEIYTRSVQDYYITGMDLRADGALLAAGGIWSNEGEVGSTLLVLGFSDQTPIAKFDFPGMIVLSVSFLNGGEVVVVGDRAAYVISRDYKAFATYDYKGHTLQGYSVNRSSGLSLAVTSTDGKNCTITTLDGDGKTVAEKDAGKPCTALYATGNAVFLLSEDTLTRYNEKLDAAEDLSCPAVSNSVLVNNNDAYLLSVSQLFKIPVG